MLFTNAFLLATSGSVAVYSVFIAIYRLFFHPLSKFPGPKLAALTKWYEFYFDILKGHGGQYAFKIRHLHQIYGINHSLPALLCSFISRSLLGPIIRINPDEIHVHDSDWHETLYTSNPTRRDKWPPAAKMAGTDLGSRCAHILFCFWMTFET